MFVKENQDRKKNVYQFNQSMRRKKLLSVCYRKLCSTTTETFDVGKVFPFYKRPLLKFMDRKDFQNNPLSLLYFLNDTLTLPEFNKQNLYFSYEFEKKEL